MRIVDQEIARAPQDMDVRAWRARLLTWSGKLAEAESEYRDILSVASEDPDDWMGLSNVYSRQGRTREALRALDRAVELDPKRSDIRLARAVALRTLGAQGEAKLEFRRAVDLDPTNAAARAGIVSMRGETKHEVRVGMNTDLFNFAEVYREEGLTLLSKWSPHWNTSFAVDGYQWGDLNSEKFEASVTGKLAAWGALTLGGATGHNNGLTPRDETFFAYCRGFNVRRNGFLRGVEITYGQHWYWYASARILTIHETALFYLPRDWSWSIGVIEAQTHFSQTENEWRPSGMTRLEFPLKRWDERRLGGNVVFAVGTENFAQADQIGEFSSHTYGGGLRFRLTALQDITGVGTYQRRSQNHDEIGFGFSYGIRF
jgi:tetratricopeptide (TPR) repeat protein